MKPLFIHVLLVVSAIGLASFSSLNAGERSVGIGPKFKGPVGLQLYSLRADFAKDVPSTLDQVRGFGIGYVELAGTYNLAPEKFKDLLKAKGLVPIAGHFGYDAWKADPEKVALEAKTLGMKYAGCAWIPHEGNFDEKKCREAIAVFNRAGEATAKHGIKFFYHNHGYEFQSFGSGTLMDLMMAETNPTHVVYEMDIFWTVHPGQDPVKLLKKYGKRWELLHLKDMKKGTPTGVLTGSSEVTNDVTLGTGQINLPPILAAAQEIGVRYYFIEDESPTAAQQIPQSLRYLEQVTW
jgi:sugar phosphate isomerase/epimerase